MILSFMQALAIAVVFIGGGLFTTGRTNLVFVGVAMAAAATAALAIIKSKIEEGMYTSYTPKTGDQLALVGHLMHTVGKEYEGRGEAAFEMPVYLNVRSGTRPASTMYVCQLDGKRTLLIEGVDDK